MIARGFYNRNIVISTLIISSVFLSGCPGSGDRGWCDETTKAVHKGNDVCFPIKNAEGYIPTYLSVNLRYTPRTEQKNRIVRDVEISNGMLCLSPDEFSPVEGKEYIVKFILKNWNYHLPLNQHLLPISSRLNKGHWHRCCNTW